MNLLYQFKTAEELLAQSKRHRVPISEITIRYEMELAGKTRAEVIEKMKKIKEVMGEAIQKGIRSKEKAFMNLAGGEAARVWQTLKKKNMLMGTLVRRAMAYSISTGETNACMGRIAAFPTAGGAGVVPGVTFSLVEEKKLSEEKHLRGLFTASAIGILIAEHATLSAAAGGCQAEVGAAVAMGTAAITEMRGGTPEQCINASAIGLKSYLGLVCDPLGGLVAVPCIKRNALGCSAAFAASDLAISGLHSFIPLDEVISAMNNIAKIMSPKLKETALGGLATTKTGLRVRKELGLPVIQS